MSGKPEIRWDSLWRRSVVMAPSRGKRPEDFGGADDLASTSAADAASNCPFCPGHESETPDTVCQVPEPPAPWQVRVVSNKFGAFTPDVPPGGRTEQGAALAYGVHEVIVETPVHDLHAADFEPAAWGRLWSVFQDRFHALRRDPALSYAFVFKNHGRRAGASRTHPHSQLVAAEHYPLILRDAAQRVRTPGACVLCTQLAEAPALGLEVERSNGLVAFAPWASAATFEVWLSPLEHATDFFSASVAELEAWGGLMQRTLRRLHSVVGAFPFNVLYHFGPFDAVSGGFHWHIEIVPRLGTLAGFELGTGDHMNSALPEVCAASLRAVNIGP